jgi:hypothetical protein
MQRYFINTKNVQKTQNKFAKRENLSYFPPKYVGYFERLVILNQPRINCSFSSIDTIKCLFNCVIFIFLSINDHVL